jgi:hypothetical protein
LQPESESLAVKYNHNHDPANGQFTAGEAGAAGASSGQLTRARKPAAAGTITGKVVSTKNPKSPVPKGYKVAGADTADVHDFVKAIAVAREKLDPQSDEYKKLTTVLSVLNQKGSSAITFKLAS